MRLNSRLYKTVSQEDFAKFKFKVVREYVYITDNDIKVIKEQPFENNNNKKIFQLIDEDYEWNPKEQSLYLSLKISMENVNELFEENGCCCKDAVLGIGLVWKPEKSKIKRCKKLFTFDAQTEKINKEIKDIELPNISSNVDFYFIIYISKAGSDIENTFIANEEGMIIYSEHFWSLIVDGSGSIFPINEIENEGGPVWSYVCDFVDITEDPFDIDHIRIEINKAHPSYSLIHPKSVNYSQAYVNEIISNAIIMIIIDVREKMDSKMIDLNEECEYGSILNVFKYFNDKLGFKINDRYDLLAHSIKTFFDKEI